MNFSFFFFFFAANFSQALLYINLATSAVPLVPFPFFLVEDVKCYLCFEIHVFCWFMSVRHQPTSANILNYFLRNKLEESFVVNSCCCCG